MTDGTQVAGAVTDTARDRLRAQVRREQELATRVLGAEARLAADVEKRDAVLRTHERLITQRKNELADALTAYIDEAGVSLERAAIVFGRSRSQLQRMLRERKTARNSKPGVNPHG